MRTYYHMDCLNCEIFLEEEDIQAVPESGRADEACAFIADKAYIKKQFRDIPFVRLRKAAATIFDNPDIPDRKTAIMFFIWHAALCIKEQRYERHGERRTKTCADGFVWLLVSHEQARKLWKADAIPLYRLYEDDSESLIETEEGLEETINGNYPIGIEVEFIPVLGNAIQMCK